MPEPGPRFVQFPHPGCEHAPRTGDMPWNTGDHCRKFLTAPGRCVEEGGAVSNGDLVFWGEWEPPSQIPRCWQRSGQLPRALHRPYWYRPPQDWPRQNTDPWVFGPDMLYSNCKQVRRSPGSTATESTAMQELSPGSVICFGSTVQGEFRLDTMFVVASSELWIPSQSGDLDVDEAFKICTGQSLAAADEHADQQFTLYRGATVDDPVDGMYGFVPARRADDADPRFPRPLIRLPDLINPKSTQAARGVQEPHTAAELQEAWNEVRDQVLEADLLLGISLETPPSVDDPGTAPPSRPSRGC